MPNRVIREAILTSSRVDVLSDKAEVFYRRLLSKVDDHGLFDARPAILRASLYPLRLDRVKEADCVAWLEECRAANLVVVYEVDGKQYVKALDTNWQVRSEPKYPTPDGEGVKIVQREEQGEEPAARARTKGEDSAPEGFDAFWSAYPKKVAKPAAQRAFKALALKNGDLERVLAAVRAQAESEDWTKESGRFIPHPATWLNQRRFEDQAPQVPRVYKPGDRLPSGEYKVAI